MTKKVIVNNNCIGCGACIAICPEVFSFGDEWIAYVNEGVDIENISSVDDAKSACPVEAIQYEWNL
jgi:ferredoxin